MAKHDQIEKKAEALSLKFLEEHGLSLVDTEYVKEAGTWYLRYYIDKEGGVTINDCETVSRFLSIELDRDDFIPDAYTLEVSSPGLGRPLKKEKDYTRNLGKPVEIRLFKAVSGKKELMGDLISWDQNSVTIKDKDSETVLEKKNIALIREYVDWNASGAITEEENENE